MNKKNFQKTNSNAFLNRRPSLKSRADTQIQAKLDRRSNVSPIKPVSRNVSKSRTGIPVKSQESDDSIDSENFEGQTEKLKQQLASSMKVFKSVTNEFITKNNQTEEEVDVFHKNFFKVKTEVAEIFLETAKSKTEMLDMKKKLGETIEKANDLHSKLYIDESSSIGLQTPDQSDKKKAKTRLKSLKEELRQLKSLIDTNEESLKNMDLENSELRVHSYRLKENFSFKKFTQESKPTIGCQSCLIF